MKFIIIFLLVTLSCAIDMGNGVVEYKERKSKKIDECDCLYVVENWFTNNYSFFAPCDYYDVGDSLNKWYRIAKKDTE